MKKITTLTIATLAVMVALPVAGYAYKAGAQVGMDSPNEYAGDGIQNTQQADDYGHYGDDEGKGGDGVQAQKGEGGAAAPMEQQKEQVQVKNQGEQKQLMEKYSAQNGEELKQVQQQARNDVRSERGKQEGRQKQVRERREEVEVAVRVLAAASDILPEERREQMRDAAAKAAVANETAVEALAEIESRSAFTRFFIGGNQEAAAMLNEVSWDTRENVHAMRDLIEYCTDCDEELLDELDETVEVLCEDGRQLEVRSAVESERRGLFGWLFGWIGDDEE